MFSLAVIGIAAPKCASATILRAMDVDLASIVHTDPEILGGTPVVSGTRVRVKALLDYLEVGHSLSEFLEDFPSVKREQVIGVLELAKELVIGAARAAGYRVRQQGGAHCNTFLALEVAFGPSSSDLCAYLDTCCEKRKVLSYDVGHAVSDTEADERVREVEKLRDLIDEWLRSHHSELL